MNICSYVNSFFTFFNQTKEHGEGKQKNTPIKHSILRIKRIFVV